MDKNKANDNKDTKNKKDELLNVVVKMLTPVVSSACASIAKVILSKWS